MPDITSLLESAFKAREAMLAGGGPLRLFNGFREGLQDLAVDLYGGTLVIFAYSKDAQLDAVLSQQALAFYRAHLPALHSAILKRRGGFVGPEVELIWGAQPDDQVTENNIHYALDLTLHQDASLYLDTRLLRQWAAANLADRRVLNTFAYTGSLGIAALAGGASEVLQTDIDAMFINLAQRSYQLNGWQPGRQRIKLGEYFRVTSSLRHVGALFDCIFLDPPFFSQTSAGQFDLNQDTARLINKVRPLLADEGQLVAVNNAVFVSGQAYMAALEDLCADGYMEIETLIPVPEDFIGLNTLRLPADPAPFNHSTKIAVLRAHRKDGRKA